MKINVKLLEKIGQTQSIHQAESVQQMTGSISTKDQVFEKIKAQNNDLICVLFPDDDDEE